MSTAQARSWPWLQGRCRSEVAHPHSPSACRAALMTTTSWRRLSAGELASFVATSRPSRSSFRICAWWSLPVMGDLLQHPHTPTLFTFAGMTGKCSAWRCGSRCNVP